MTSFRTFAKYHGPVAQLGYMVYRLFQRLIIFDVTRIYMIDSHQMIKDESDESIEVRALSVAEVEDLANDPSLPIEKQHAQRLTTGFDFCIAALVDGEVAGYTWVAVHSIEGEMNRQNDDPNSGVALEFPSDYTFAYNLFTRQRFRKRGIGKILLTHWPLQMQQRGFRYHFCTTDWTNTPANRLAKSLNYDYLGSFWLVRCLGRSWLAHQPKSLVSRGITAGDQATVKVRSDLVAESTAFPQQAQEKTPELQSV